MPPLGMRLPAARCNERASRAALRTRIANRAVAILCGLLLSCLVSAAWCAHADAPPVFRFDLAAQPLEKSLRELSEVASEQIIFTDALVRGIQAPALRGSYSSAEALRRLLAGTRLAAERSKSGVIMIKRTAQPPDGAESRRPTAPPELEQPTQRATSRATPLVESMNEVIVMARRREERLVSVPVIETVIAQRKIEQHQLGDLRATAPWVPGLLFGSGVGAIGTSVAIRGIGNTATNATVDQSVSLNVDGLQLNQGLAYQVAMFDVAQVEVLKGPQALFWGKNSPAGVISLRSADPSSTSELVVRAGHEHEARKKLGELIVSGAVARAVKLRLATRYTEDSGYFRNLVTAPEGFGVKSPARRSYATDETWIVRATALWEPAESYQARLKWNYHSQLVDHGGGTMQVAACPFGLVSFTGLPVFDPNEDCRLDRNAYVSYMDPAHWRGIRNGGVPFAKLRQGFGTLEQNLHLYRFAFSAVTGLYELHQQSLINGSGNSGLTALAPDNDFFIRQFTQEVRTSTSFDGPMNAMMGFFYQNARMVNDIRILANTGIPNVPLPALLQEVKHGIDIESISAFGQAVWHVTDRIEASIGARWTEEQRTHTQDNLGTPDVPPGPTPLLEPRIESDNISPEFTLTYRPTDDLTLFGSYKQGFKSGSFNTVAYIDPATPASFGDEKVEGGEVGFKARLLDRRLNLNLAAYAYHYSGLQVGASEITPQGVIAIRTINAATANVKGIDFDATYAPAWLHGLGLFAAVNYNAAHFGSFPNAPCSNGQLIAEGCNRLLGADGAYHAQDLSGRPLVKAPRWTINAGLDYELPLRPSTVLALGASATYTSKYYTSLLLRPLYVQDHYTKVNLNAALRGANDTWEIALIGNNVTDEITTSNCLNGQLQGAVIFGGTVSGTNTRGPGGDDYPYCLPERGRELWLRFTLRR